MTLPVAFGSNDAVVNEAVSEFTFEMYSGLTDTDPGLDGYIWTPGPQMFTVDGHVLWVALSPDMPEHRGSREFFSPQWFSMNYSEETKRKGLECDKDAFDALNPRWQAYSYLARELGGHINHDKRLTFVALMASGDGPKYGLVYDGQTMFSLNHPNPKGVQRNLWNLPFSGESFDAIRRAKRSRRDVNGAQFRIKHQWHVIIGPKHETAAERLFTLPGQDDNPYYNKATFEIWDELEGEHEDTWFMQDRGMPENMRPIIFRETRAPQLIPRMNPDHDNVFYEGKYQVGLDCSWGMTPARWESIDMSKPS